MKPKAASSTPPQEETNALESVLGSRQDRHPFEQLLLPLLLIIRSFRHHRFDGALGTHLVEIFGDATDRLSHHHVNHAEQLRPTCRDGHQHQQRKDLQQRAHPEGEPKPVAGADPTAVEVGDHPEELVKEKQKGDLEGCVAELVEMEHHQHPQGTVGEGEGPVVGGDDAVLLES